MLTAALYNMNGEKIGEVELPKKIFNVALNPDLVHQVIVAQAANKRHVLAHTKDRGEVSGGGKKPWAQKGTGRARHGSTRSPLWRHGGITFGPTKERNFSQKINKKMKQKALLIALSAKARDHELIVLDQLALSEPKTRMMSGLLDKLPLIGKKTLITLAKSDRNVLRATRNLSYAKAVMAADLSVSDVVKYQYLMMPKDAIQVLENKFT